MIRDREPTAAAAIPPALRQIDAELRRVFAQELRARLETLEPRAEEPPEVRRRALHALKGAAAMIGLIELADRIGRAETWLRAGNAEMPPLLLDELRDLADHLESSEQGGMPVEAPTGPIEPASGPPEADAQGSPSMSPSFAPVPDPTLHEVFVAEAQDRLAAIERSVVAHTHEENAREEIEREIFRHLHGLKGAALAVGATAVAEAAHRLEDMIHRAQGADRRLGTGELEALSRGSQAIGRALAQGPRPASGETPIGVDATFGRRSSEGPSGAAESRPDRRRDPAGIVRVAVTRLDRLVDGLGEMTHVRDRLDTRSESFRGIVRDLSASRGALARALRAIGPPRPWGAPAHAIQTVRDVAAALTNAAAVLESIAEDSARDAAALRRVSSESREELTTMRTTRAQWLFERVVPVVQTTAQRLGKDVVVTTSGADVRLDRGVAEALLDPVLQLCRNALVHGIEPAHVRVARGKSARGVIELAAEATGERLLLSVSDDGAGVDLDRVRQVATQRGLLDPEQAELADRETLLGMIFAPGLTTRARADDLAGRGVGLDVVRDAAMRLGGSARIANQPTSTPGTRAELRIPHPVAVSRLLVVRAEGQRYAFPLDVVESVAPVGTPRSGAARPAVPLVELVAGTPSRGASGAVVRLAAGGGIDVEVDEAIGPDEMVVRRFAGLLAGFPPYAGAAIAGDGEVTLVLDAEELAAGPPLPVREQETARILVVDDSPTSRAFLASELRAAGFEVDLAGDGWEAARTLGLRTYALLVTDLEMPGVHGLDLLARLSRGEYGAPIPAIVVTSRAGGDVESRACAAGARAVLFKPTSGVVLVETVRRTIRAASEA
ncbi:MAG: Hpt domain-containing protein [Deltaproteobacteria bacterium]|nr:Hpt domain-containing protein [Deltaproteobacteria bacterium]